MSENEQDLVPDETPDGETPESAVPSEEPDYKSMFEETQRSSQARLDELNNQLSNLRAGYDARANQLENLLLEIARGNNAKPTEETIDPDDPAALYKLTMRDVEQKFKERDSQVNQRIQMLADREHVLERQTLEAQEPLVMKRFKNEIDDYYVKNPAERHRPGSLTDVVTFLKGKHFEVLAEEMRKQPRRSAAPAMPTPTNGNSLSPRPPVEAKPELDQQEERLLRIYSQLEGKEIKPEDWLDVRTNREKYPGRRPGGRR